jgi:RHS repeat-associated protein
MNRELDPAGFTQNQTIIIPKKTTWSDYDDDEIYGDFEIANGLATPTNQYVPGLWRSEHGVSEYLHGDMLGTLRQSTTAADGQPTSPRVFTAFGERMVTPPTPDRYGYAGAWGYQQHEEFPFLHVGARYYHPGSGRFLQRDPIGIHGGFNTYGYTGNRPSARIDPGGLQEGPPAPPDPETEPERAQMWRDMDWEAQGPNNNLPPLPPPTPWWKLPPPTPWGTKKSWPDNKPPEEYFNCVEAARLEAERARALSEMFRGRYGPSH